MIIYIINATIIHVIQYIIVNYVQIKIFVIHVKLVTLDIIMVDYVYPLVMKNRIIGKGMCLNYAQMQFLDAINAPQVKHVMNVIIIIY